MYFCMFIGDPQYDIKGSQYFIDKLNQCNIRMRNILEEYRTKLDEQRNFWGFILALFSVATFPLLFSTSYWYVFIYSTSNDMYILVVVI
jgi:hypothetical protein